MVNLTLENLAQYTTNQYVILHLTKRLNEGVNLSAMAPGSTITHEIQYCACLDRGFVAVKTNPKQFN